MSLVRWLDSTEVELAHLVEEKTNIHPGSFNPEHGWMTFLLP